MSSSRIFVLISVGMGIAGIAHALLTWPLSAVMAFFAGGALVAFIAEAIAINLGWLDHHIGPKILGVPLYVLFAWTGLVYLVFRVTLLVSSGMEAVLLTAVIATGYDILTDHQGVEQGHWTYTDELPGPRYRGVPWWNYAGWFVISAVTPWLATVFL